MQNICYQNNDFVKEYSNQYILSIRFSTDGLSFCIHDTNDHLLVFSFKPHTLTSQDEVIAKTKNTIFQNKLYKKQTKGMN